MIRLHTDGLLRRLLRFILLFSLCFTVLASSVQLYFEYRREMRDIEARMALIRAGYLASLERSLWDLDEAQLDTQLRGLVDFSDVARVRLVSDDFQLLRGEAEPKGPLRIERFPLDYQPPRARPGTWVSWKSVSTWVRCTVGCTLPGLPACCGWACSCVAWRWRCRGCSIAWSPATCK
ncbi:hypothetical protein GLGCALEP_02622 [Pseudomonas sp. MM221]|nr:hypothetical protein GLGCALEP_02622 [Pseudomonas sp. MM221]